MIRGFEGILMSCHGSTSPVPFNSDPLCVSAGGRHWVTMQIVAGESVRTFSDSPTDFSEQEYDEAAEIANDSLIGDVDDDTAENLFQIAGFITVAVTSRHCATCPKSTSRTSAITISLFRADPAFLVRPPPLTLTTPLIP
jgi:hypothetical protein